MNSNSNNNSNATPTADESFVDASIKNLTGVLGKVLDTSITEIDEYLRDDKKKQGGASETNGLRRRRVAQTQETQEELTSRQQLGLNAQNHLSRNDATEALHMARNTQHTLLELQQQVGRMAGVLDKVSEQQDDMRKTQEDINEGVKSIRKTLKRGLSSRECDGNRKFIEAFVILSASAGVAAFTMNFFSFMQPHAFGLYTGLGMSKASKCFNELVNIIFELLKKLINMTISLNKVIYSSGSVFLDAIPLGIGKLAIVALLIFLIFINITLIHILFIVLGIKKQGIIYLIHTTCSYISTIFTALFNSLPTSLQDLGAAGEYIDAIFQGLFGMNCIDTLKTLFGFIKDMLKDFLTELVRNALPGMPKMPKMPKLPEMPKLFGGERSTSPMSSTLTPSVTVSDFKTFFESKKSVDAFNTLIRSVNKSKKSTKKLMTSDFSIVMERGFRQAEVLFVITSMGTQTMNIILKLLINNKISKVEENLIKGVLKSAEMYNSKSKPMKSSTKSTMSPKMKFTMKSSMKSMLKHSKKIPTISLSSKTTLSAAAAGGSYNKKK